MSDFWNPEWETRRIGELCNVIDPHPSHRAPEEKQDGIYFLGIGDLSEDGQIIGSKARRVSPDIFFEHQQYYQITGNTIGFCRVASVGKVIEFKEEYPEAITISPTLAIIEPRDIEKKFLAYCLRSRGISEQVASLSSGSTRESLGIKILRDLIIPIPPLPEQRKIAEILSGIDIAIAKNKTRVQKLDTLQFSLTEVFTQDLHENFEALALEEHAEVRTGVAKNSNSEGDMVEMPYMRVANVQDGYLDLSEIKSISVDRGRTERYLLRKGDVLINEGGDLDKVGRGVIWHEEIKQCLHQNHVFAVRCSEQLMPEFLSLYLKSSHSKNYFLGCAKQTTNLASINSTQLKSFPIPVPPLRTQEQFVEHIRSARNLSFAIATEISGLEAMKKGVASDLLSGRKRVCI